MLSTVESHFGPGRAYSHHFAGPAVPSLLPHCPLSTLPVLSSTAAAMSAAEFARPHPKPRYNNGPIRNGLTSPRSKYSEQTGPVNLAVSQQQTSATLSLADTSIPVPQTQSDIEPVSPSISSLYGPPKLSYCSPQVTGAHVYQTLSYPNLYARNYGPPVHYPPHPLTNRSQLHHTSSYITGQLDSYSNYIPQVKITPPYVIPSSQTSPGNGSNSGKSSSVNDRSQLLMLTQQQQLNSNMHNKDKESKLYLYVPTAKTHPSNVISSSDPISSPCSYVTMPSSKASLINECGNLITANEKVAGFKVPSGKEGSLKHRILTRPYADREIRIKPSIHGSVVRSTNNNNTSTNFSKGSLIELANGELRRVEDMRTEDFILSSNKNPELQMADTTVVKIAPDTQSNVMITFSYNGNTFDMDTRPEHPFFVYGHGWASCNPESSIQAFGLKCQRLQVGDVCISLTPREQTSQMLAAATQSYYHNDDISQVPQNLSKKPETIPTTATGTTVTSRPVPPFDCHQSLAFYASYLNSSSMNAAIAASNAASMLANVTNNINDDRRHHATSNHHHSSLLRNVHIDDTSLKLNHQHISGNTMTTTCNTAIASKHPTMHGMGECDGNNDVIDATFSKKRRWSAPVICDDDMCRKSGQKNCNHSNHVYG